jgi:hypothetical protein
MGGFAAQYARAREAQAEHFLDEIMEISDDPTNDWMARRGDDGAAIVVSDHEAYSALEASGRYPQMGNGLHGTEALRRPMN